MGVEGWIPAEGPHLPHPSRGLLTSYTLSDKIKEKQMLRGKMGMEEVAHKGDSSIGGKRNGYQILWGIFIPYNFPS